MRIVLLANDKPGFEVAKYLNDRGDKIIRLYLHSKDFQKWSREIIKASGCSKKEIFLDSDLKKSSHIRELKKLNPDFIITVFWKWILPIEVISIASKGTINFHPAMLPVGRGWFPHVHSFINRKPTGVTIHAMDKEADTGPIWAQKEVPIESYDTALDIYDKLQIEIVKLFKKNWPAIASGRLKATPQDPNKGTYYKKNEIDKLDLLDLNKNYKGSELINLLRARSFGDLGFAYYMENGKKVYLNLRLSPTNKFPKKKVK